MSKLAPISSKPTQRIDSVELAERSLSRVEVAALKRIDVIRERSLGSVVDVTIKPRDYSHLTGKGKEELTSFFETEIEKATSVEDVGSLLRDYEDLSAELEVDLPVELEDPHGTGLEIEGYEKSLGDIPEVEGCLRRTLGLNSSAASRTLSVKEEELQTDLNKALGTLLKIIQTEDPIDAFVGNDEAGKPRIHTLTVYRSVDEQLVPVHYNLTDESEWVRLLIDNVEAAGGEYTEEQALEHLERYREALGDVAKELDRVSNEVSPRIGKGANYSSSSIGNINGTNPFAQIGPRAGGILQDPNFMKNTVTKMMSDPKYGMVDSNGKLNERGRKTLKEIAAASKLIDNEQAHLQKKLSSLSTRRQDIETNPKRDRLVDQAELARITTEMDALQKQIAELGQAAKASAAISIIQLNRDVTLVKADGSGVETMTVREALKKADSDEASNYTSFEVVSDDRTEFSEAGVLAEIRGAVSTHLVSLIKEDGSKELVTLKEATVIAQGPDASKYVKFIDAGVEHTFDSSSLQLKSQELSGNFEVVLLKSDGSEEKKTGLEALAIAKDKTLAANYKEIRVDESHKFDAVNMRQVLGLRMQKDFEGFMIDQNTSWYQTKPGATRWFKPFAPDKVKLEESRAGFELGNVLFYKGATSAKKADPSFRILNQIRHEDRSMPLGQEISGMNWILPAAEALVTGGGDLVERVQAHHSGLSKEAIEQTRQMVEAMTFLDIEQTPEEAVKGLRKANIISDYRGWFRRKIDSDV